MINKKSSIIISTFISLLFLLSACNPKEIYSEFHSLPDAIWNKNNPAVFEVEVQDSTLAYDLFINVRNNNNYSFQNLWLFIESNDETGNITKDTLNIELADIYGKWHGKGFSIYSLSFPYKESYRYPNCGKYTYKIEHGMREETLLGVSDIGFVVSKGGNK
ncbi:gliding motility lipoprotein GldH [Bacteroidales bacterium OttesenSCG-928-M11]|nr:gliding motility lipoprotein GldH [Bacteroidales bacterium OttesenSCG-928-M11]